MLSLLNRFSTGETEIFHDVSLRLTVVWDQSYAMKKGSSNHILSVNEANKLVPEGIEYRVAYKGTILFLQMIGGIRSGMGYRCS